MLPCSSPVMYRPAESFLAYLDSMFYTKIWFLRNCRQNLLFLGGNFCCFANFSRSLCAVRPSVESITRSGSMLGYCLAQPLPSGNALNLGPSTILQASSSWHSNDILFNLRFIHASARKDWMSWGEVRVGTSQDDGRFLSVGSCASKADTWEVCNGIGDGQGCTDSFSTTRHVIPKQQLCKSFLHQLYLCNNRWNKNIPSI